MWYFSEPLRGEEKYEQWAKCPLVLYAKPSNKRFIISLQKIVILQLASIFLVRVFRNILIPSVRMMLTMRKIFGRIICQTIEWEVSYFTGSRGYVFVVRTSKPVENLWKKGLFWSRYSFVTHSIYPGFVLLLKLLENYLNIFCKFKGAWKLLKNDKF